MQTERLKALSAAHEKLFLKLFNAQEELRKRETSCGTYHDVRKMTKLRAEIASLENRLTICERAMEAT